jgi:hypothetical protein
MFFAAACNQDPIFTMISNEVEPKDPLINGSPSKFATIGNDIYVANGKLWKYSEKSWSQAGGPSNVYDIAVVKTTLYLLSVGDSGCTVYKRDSTGGITAISNNSGYGMIQGIYGNDSDLYAGGSNGSDGYALLWLKPDGALDTKYTIGSPLTGVAGDYYATARNGIFKITGNAPVSFTSDYTIAGIIKIDTKIIAVSSGGTIFNITDTSAALHEPDYNFTGALAEYTPKDSGGRKLLLIGVKGSVYSLGYLETWIPDDGTGAFSLRSPGGTTADSTIPISVQDKYSATLEKCAVNSLIKVDDEDTGGWPVIFASTQKDGLWSYRNGEWNAEE